MLQRQLKKLKLSFDKMPSNLSEWQAILTHIENAYNEADQDRYLVERSMEISSKEMRELYDNLQHAQEIAKLGIWSYNSTTDVFSWSKEMASLLLINTNNVQVTLQAFEAMIVPELRDLFHQAFIDAFISNNGFEIEVCIQNQEDKIGWLYLIGKPKKIGDIVHINGASIDITRLKQTEEKITELHNKLLESARLAGMAEVATSVLHNVGNLLNSVNVSVQLLHRKIGNLHIKQIRKLADLFRNNQSDLSTFLESDAKGKLIPSYLEELSQATDKECVFIDNELNNIMERIQDIREIIFVQQDLSGVSGVLGEYHLEAIIEEALKISGIFQNNDIKVSSVCDIHSALWVEKSKLSLILINFLRNAKDAVLADDKKEKIISIKAYYQGNKVIISVEDNGIGIKATDKENILNYGFTTKKNGHGFGLNSSVSAANQIQGKIICESKGEGAGAKFSLIFLPGNNAVSAAHRK